MRASEHGMRADWSFMTHTEALWARGGKDVVSAATTLRKLCVNVLESPGVLRYRRVRIAKIDGLLPESVMLHCGYSRVKYHDGASYFVMNKVDEALLRAVVKELDVGITTAEQVLGSRSRAAAREDAPAEVHQVSPTVPVWYPSQPGTSTEPVTEMPREPPASVLERLQASAHEAAPSLECQLRARSAVHSLGTSTAAAAAATAAAAPAPLAPPTELTEELQRLQASARDAPSLDAQLRARSAAHKLSVRQASTSRLGRLALGAICAAATALLAVCVGWLQGTQSHGQ